MVHNICRIFSAVKLLLRNNREYGRANLEITDPSCILLQGISNGTQVWMSHADTIVRLPEDYHIVGNTNDVKIGAFVDKG